MPLLVPDKVNMNYANMIEDKNLKKTFIIATLVSTLVGTFAASHNLYERLNQKKKDENQDGAIKKLEDRVNTISKEKTGNSEKDDLKDSLDKSGRLIKREYDVGYNRLGRKFAAGDIFTENELQKQIILLQQTVIGVLEDALYNGRQIDRAGVDKLVRASTAARRGSLDALKGQYERIAQAWPRPRTPPKAIEAAKVIELSSRGPSPRSPPVKALLPPFAQAKPLLSPPTSRPAPPPPIVARPHPQRRTSGRDFYCRYSVDLQLSPRPLSRAFDPSRGSTCPVCSVKLAVDSADMWELKVPVKEKLPPAKVAPLNPSPPVKSPPQDKEKKDAKDRGGSKIVKEAAAVAVAEQKPKMVKFQIPAKFVVKCHTPEGEYACVLCCGPSGNYSGVVVLCDDPESLVDHVVKEHKAAEIEKEIDIITGQDSAEYVL